MQLEFFDSHTHLDAKEFAEDQDEVIVRAREAGVTRLLTVGAGNGYQSAERAVSIAARHSKIWASVGVHPHDAKEKIDINRLKALATESKVVAIGETGLDFYRDWAPVELQRLAFRAQIELALELNKPLIIHSREAGEECLQILEEMNAELVGGVFHCYAEDAAFAERLSEINFYVSFPGTVTFKKALNVQEAARLIPLKQILVETDAPYMAPEPHRGKRCESAFVVETACKIAEIKGVALEEVAAVTTKNACELFKL